MADTPISILDLGKRTKKAIKRLKRGSDPKLLAKIQERMGEAMAANASAVPVFVLYEKKPKKRAKKLKNLLRFRKVGLLPLP